MKQYIATYPYRGSYYSVTIPADTWEEAEGRLKGMAYGKVDGEVALVIPLSPGGILRRLFGRKQ